MRSWILNHWLIQEKFWVAFSALITTAALVYTITWNQRTARKKKNNLKFTLFTETFTNINSIFSGQVDRPLLFDAIKVLRGTYANDVKDTGMLAKWQDLYLWLEHYDRFVTKIYLTDSNVDSRYVTERQLITCNVLLGHFGEKPIKYDVPKLQGFSGGQYIEKKRNEAIKIKEKKLGEWTSQISQETDDLL